MKKHLSFRRTIICVAAVIALIGISAVLRTLAQSQSGFEYNGIVQPFKAFHRSSLASGARDIRA